MPIKTITQSNRGQRPNRLGQIIIRANRLYTPLHKITGVIRPNRIIHKIIGASRPIRIVYKIFGGLTGLINQYMK